MIGSRQRLRRATCWRAPSRSTNRRETSPRWSRTGSRVLPGSQRGLLRRARAAHLGVDVGDAAGGSGSLRAPHAGHARPVVAGWDVVPRDAGSGLIGTGCSARKLPTSVSGGELSGPVPIMDVCGALGRRRRKRRRSRLRVGAMDAVGILRSAHRTRVVSDCDRSLTVAARISTTLRRAWPFAWPCPGVPFLVVRLLVARPGRCFGSLLQRLEHGFVVGDELS